MAKVRQRLSAANIDPMSYSIGAHREEAYRPEQSGDGTWITDHAERGTKSHVDSWTDESSACIYFLGLVAWSEWDGHE